MSHRPQLFNVLSFTADLRREVLREKERRERLEAELTNTHNTIGELILMKKQSELNMAYLWMILLSEPQKETASRETNATSRQHAARDVTASRHNDVIVAVREAVGADVSARTPVRSRRVAAVVWERSRDERREGGCEETEPRPSHAHEW